MKTVDQIVEKILKVQKRKDKLLGGKAPRTAVGKDIYYRQLSNANAHIRALSWVLNDKGVIL